MALTALGTLSYDTYSFNETAETITFQMRNVLDSTQRTVAYTTYTIAIRWVVKAEGGQTLDQKMDALRAVLLQPGKTFTYLDRGGGTITVTPAADVKFGPLPQLISVKPLGNAGANELVWQVEFSVVSCADGVSRNQPMEFTYSLDTTVDRGGYSTRVYKARIRVPLGREAGRTLTDSADRWLEQMLPQPLPGFRRVRGPANLDETKSQLTVTVTDEEMSVNIPPAGVVDIQARHTVNSMNRGFNRWACTFSATIEMARDQPRERAFTRFMELFDQRKGVIARNLRATEFRQNLAVNVLPVSFSFEETNVFGRECGAFSVGFVIQQPLSNILKASALWTPTDTTWDTWKSSLKGSAFAARGNAGLRFNPADDAIIDLCLTRTPRPPTQTVTLKPPGKDALKSLSGPCPAAKDSWLLYECRLEAEGDSGVAVLTPLPKTELAVVPTRDFFGTNGGYQLQSYVSQPDSVVQKRVGSGNVIYLVGAAVRVCYGIPPPELRKVGDVPATLANRADRGEGFKTWVWGDFGHTVYAATWRNRYVLTRPSQTTLTGIRTPTSSGGATLTGTGTLQNNLITGNNPF